MRSAFTVQRAPARHTDGEALMRAIRPTNASVSRLRMQERTRFLFVFTWRITYRADDKRQEIYTIWMDDGARPLAPSGAAEAAPELEQMLADAEAVPTESNEAGETITSQAATAHAAWCGLPNRRAITPPFTPTCAASAMKPRFSPGCTRRSTVCSPTINNRSMRSRRRATLKASVAACSKPIYSARSPRRSKIIACALRWSCWAMWRWRRRPRWPT